MTHHRFLGIAVLGFLLSQSAISQGVSLSIVGGISKDSRTQTENMWKSGLNIAAQGFLLLPGFAVGGRVAYHHWGTDGEG